MRTTTQLTGTLCPLATLSCLVPRVRGSPSPAIPSFFTANNNGVNPQELFKH